MTVNTAESTGLRMRAEIAPGRRVYIIATRGEDGRCLVTWTMPAENRRQEYRGRRISPAEAHTLKNLIIHLLEQL